MAATAEKVARRREVSMSSRGIANEWEEIESRNVQVIIDRLAAGEISESEALRLLEQLWEEAYKRSTLESILARLLPSLSRRFRQAE